VHGSVACPARRKWADSQSCSHRALTQASTGPWQTAPSPTAPQARGMCCVACRSDCRALASHLGSHHSKASSAAQRLLTCSMALQPLQKYLQDQKSVDSVYRALVLRAWAEPLRCGLLMEACPPERMCSRPVCSPDPLRPSRPVHVCCARLSLCSQPSRV
jgi:hypothetical protein